MSFRSRFGPGFIVSAAFVGPGTVITCSAAGAGFGTALAWALLFAGLTTFILQDMSMRLSLGSNDDLAASIRTLLPGMAGSVLGWAVALMVTTGCIAYQAGNLTGGAQGMRVLFGDVQIWLLVQGALAGILLWSGAYRIIETILMALVGVMSVSFFVALVLNPPDPGAVFSGLFSFAIPEGSLLTLLALIGTTVVPYNFFLHSRAVREKWLSGHNAPVSLVRIGRMDLGIGVCAGIIISLSILLSSSSVLQGARIDGVATLAGPLSTSFGQFGSILFGIGLWAAGLTSAITAPLAAGYTIAGAAGWAGERRDRSIRLVWITVLLIGLLFALLSTNPVPLIIAAQAFNGLLLPGVVVVLLVLLNRRSLQSAMRNAALSNVLGLLAGGIALLIALRTISHLLGFW